MLQDVCFLSLCMCALIEFCFIFLFHQPLIPLRYNKFSSRTFWSRQTVNCYKTRPPQNTLKLKLVAAPLDKVTITFCVHQFVNSLAAASAPPLRLHVAGNKCKRGEFLVSFSPTFLFVGRNGRLTIPDCDNTLHLLSGGEIQGRCDLQVLLPVR